MIQIHVFEFCYGTGPGSPYGSVPYATAYFVGRLGVPLFLMLTGYLVFARDYSEEGTVARFYSRSFPKLLRTIVFWVLAYGALFLLFGKATVDDVVLWALQLDDLPLGHWWYVPAIISLYAVLPLASRAIDGLSPKTLAVPSVMLLVWGFLLPTYNQFANVLGMDPLDSSINSAYLLGVYGGYVLAGSALRKAGLADVARRWGLGLVVPLVAVMVVGTGLTLEVVGTTSWYNSILVALGGALLFVVLYRVGQRLRHGLTPTVARVLEWVSKASFAAYFLHYVVLLVLSWNGLWLAPGLVRSSLVFLFIVAVSFGLLAVAWKLLARHPVARSVVFHA